MANTREALGRLGACYRRDFTLPVVAVAGSNGKSTTKELIAAVLARRFRVLHSPASFNNDIGVPQTLLELEQAHQAAVLEAGTNHPGELAPLVAMIQPRFGVLTGLGREHLEFFGDLAGVAAEEGALAEGLPSDGRLFLHAQGDLIETVARRARAPVVRVGWDATHDWTLTRWQADAAGSDFTVRAPGADFSGEYRLNLLGRHQLTNALLAIAVGAELGLKADEIRLGLSECRPLKMRLQSWEWCGVRVLDDSYNANADSMLAALETLRDLPCAGRRWAVLGDMAELGEATAAAHTEVGRRAAQCGLHRLVVVGAMGAVTGAAAREAGLAEVEVCGNADEAARLLRSLATSGDVVLLKASRSSGLERVGEALRAD